MSFPLSTIQSRYGVDKRLAQAILKAHWRGPVIFKAAAAAGVVTVFLISAFSLFFEFASWMMMVSVFLGILTGQFIGASFALGSIAAAAEKGQCLLCHYSLLGAQAFRGVARCPECGMDNRTSPVHNAAIPRDGEP